MPGDYRLLQETEIVPHVLVSRQVSVFVSAQLLNMTTFLCSAKIKKKMLYSSSFDALKKALVGVQKFIQVTASCKSLKQYHFFSMLKATDASEASEENVEKQLRSTDRV